MLRKRLIKVLILNTDDEEKRNFLISSLLSPRTTMNAFAHHLTTSIGKLVSLLTGSCSSTCHPKRPPETLSELLAVRLFQVHPAHSHYLTYQINLLSAQVFVPQVLVEVDAG